MRIGINLIDADPVEQCLGFLARAEQAGFATAWVTQYDHLDTLTLLALAGQVTHRIELGMAVLPTYPQHPALTARQVITVQQATGNRLTLGLGVSHKAIVEDMLGLQFARPIRHMREYLAVLYELLDRHSVDFEGELFRVHLAFPGQPAPRPPILLAALGPQMLKLAGNLADGTVISLGGEHYLRTRAVPLIRQAAREAGRPLPRVAASFAVAVTRKRDAARRTVSEALAWHVELPSYKAILEIDGARNGADVSIIGDEAEVNGHLERLAEAGVTDFSGHTFVVPGDPEAPERTWEYLAAAARSGKFA